MLSRVVRRFPLRTVPRHTAWAFRTFHDQTSHVAPEIVTAAEALGVPADNKLPMESFEVKTVSYVPHGMHLIWQDGHVSRFRYVWLRDACKCSQCVDASTGQRFFDAASVDLAIEPVSTSFVSMNGEHGKEMHLELHWPATQGAPAHVTHLSLAYLRAKCWESNKTLDLSKQLLWQNKDIGGKDALSVAYPDLDQESNVLELMHILTRYGLAFVRNVPRETGMVKKVAQRISYVRETSYGVTFDVVSEPDPEHLAYTGLPLDFHTDLNYREASPGLQFLHCIESSPEGGHSTFVDGFRAAAQLRKHHPSDFSTLSSIAVEFAIKSEKTWLSNHVPVIVTDHMGTLQEIHYNNRTMYPLVANQNLVLPFYAAYKQFSSLLRLPESTFSVRLDPGDLVIFNNRRVLHGRTAFDASQGRRFLEGCYVDFDEFQSRLRTLETKQRA